MATDRPSFVNDESYASSPINGSAGRGGGTECSVARAISVRPILYCSKKRARRGE